ncbi:MAG TPA: hypothetical protein VKP11_02720 [Frankiaceae bacterium]|nr:hypothetical protein [Frankiaceae bacterium]
MQGRGGRLRSHEGRYDAIAQGKGLQANDDALSPGGSLERACHETALPRVVVDLRKAEEGVAVYSTTSVPTRPP